MAKLYNFSEHKINRISQSHFLSQQMKSIK